MQRQAINRAGDCLVISVSMSSTGGRPRLANRPKRLVSAPSSWSQANAPWASGRPIGGWTHQGRIDKVLHAGVLDRIGFEGLRDYGHDGRDRSVAGSLWRTCDQAGTSVRYGLSFFKRLRAFVPPVVGFCARLRMIAPASEIKGSVPFPEPPPDAMAGIEVLIGIDPDFARVLDQAGPLPWRRRTPGFPGLLQAIVAQMISNQAAAAIWGRLRAIPGALDPCEMMGVPDDLLRAAGLSRPKVVHAKALAAAFLDGTLSAERIAMLDDEAAIVTIGSVKGLGRWTAEIYLLFALDRLDVFPSGDIALAASMADLKALPARPAPRALREMAVAWRPVRSLAARLLWHHWRHVTGCPAMDDFKLV